jgi:hypothetical protein
MTFSFRSLHFSITGHTTNPVLPSLGHGRYNCGFYIYLIINTLHRFLHAASSDVQIPSTKLRDAANTKEGLLKAISKMVSMQKAGVIVMLIPPKNGGIRMTMTYLISFRMT